MPYSQQQVVVGLTALAEWTGQGVGGTARLGNTSIETGAVQNPALRAYPAAQIIGSIRIWSNNGSGTATLNLGSLAVNLSAGISSDGDTFDFQGDTQATLARICGLRIRTKSTNLATVTLGGSNSGVCPAGTLSPDTDIVVAYPVAGRLVSGTITFAFGGLLDTVWVDVLGLA